MSNRPISPKTPSTEHHHQEQPSSPPQQSNMLFGAKLEREIHPPWKQYYMNYNHLKKLLKEGVILKDNWTDKDEQNFVSALDESLEKVYTFQHDKYEELNDKLDTLQSQTEQKASFDVDSFLKKLDEIMQEAQLLEHFQRLNYTGFIKIVRKHDRLHSNYSVKALLSVRLKKMPFHSEDYSPLLYKIGTLFQFVRNNYQVDEASLSKLSSFNDGALSGEFQSFKFWIHPDNLMEVKTTILRHLPVLIYNNLGNDQDDDDDDDDEEDDNAQASKQTINCLYFDNEQLELYNNKLTKLNNSSTLRIKWNGKLSEKPKITMERKEFDVNSNFHVDDKIELRQKYINQFVIHKQIPQKLAKLNGEANVKKLLDFIKEYNLQPVLRTSYNRTAFQIPGDDKIRITIDSNITFIREDSFDSQLPIRDPSQWHRLDIDQSTKPHQFLRKGEFNKFPYSAMEIKIKKSAVKNFKRLQWINELINATYLIKEIPNFSKFIHGIACLFLEDDKLDNIPMWFNELDGNIIAEVPRIPIKSTNNQGIAADLTAEDNLSKFKSMILNNQTANFQPRSASFSGSILYKNEDDLEQESIDSSSAAAVTAGTGTTSMGKITSIAEEEQSAAPEPPVSMTTDDQSSDFEDEEESRSNPLVKMLNIPSRFSKLSNVDSEEEEVDLPVGVSRPEQWIKNMGPIKIEPKVWMANERTFNRWLHVTTLFSGLTFIIYSSTLNSNFEHLSTYLAYFYFGLTLFCGIWGYYVFMQRRSIILERSDKHLDNSLGPLVVAFGLIFALIVNFVFGWKSIQMMDNEDFYAKNEMHRTIHQFVIDLVN